MPEEAQDPWTITILEKTGVHLGRRSLEIDAGAGTIASWWSECVSSDGSEMVTDIEPDILLSATVLGEELVFIRCIDHAS